MTSRLSFLEELRVQYLCMVEPLKGIELRTTDDSCHMLYDVSVHERFYARGPEFIGNRGLHDDLDTRTDVIRMILCLYQCGVLRRSRLNIHSNVIHQALINESLYRSGAAAICVHFYRITHPFDLFTKEGQILYERGFSSRNHDPIQKPLAAFEEFVDASFIKKGGTQPLTAYEIWVVAIGAVEVTPREKEDTA
jgi:hypothetical protein